MGTACRYALVIIRLYLGAWMLLNGLNHFLPIFPQPMGGTLGSSQLLVTLIETGLFGLVKSIETVVGILLLFDVCVPLALVAALPVSVVVWYNHAILSGKPFDFSMGIGCLMWNLTLMLAYVRYYLPMMRVRAFTGRLADLSQVRHELFPPMNSAERESGNSPEVRHRAAIAIVGVLVTVALGCRLHPWTTQPAGSGKTPTSIVREYMALAYASASECEAERLYMAPEAAAVAHQWASPFESQREVPALASVIAQGANVVVYYRLPPTSSTPASGVVDRYRVAKSRIVEFTRVTDAPRGKAAPAAPCP